MFDALVLSHQVPEDWRAQAEVFGEIFSVFLVIGTLVGVVVVGYTLYHAYRARDTGGKDDGSFDPPVLGELPSGQTGPKSKKLFVSFGLSAVIVISLVVYSYFLLLYVEQGPTEEVGDDAAEQLEIEVVGIQFGWQFHYPSGVESFNELRVPQGEVIRLSVTSGDVWHNFGVPELRVKADSIPGQYQHTWFIANETGTYDAACYELCGSGHSDMTAEIIVMENEEYQEWHDEQAADAEGDDETEGTESEAGSGEDSEREEEAVGESTPVEEETDDGESTSTPGERIAAPAGVIAA